MSEFDELVVATERLVAFDLQAVGAGRHGYDHNATVADVAKLMVDEVTTSFRVRHLLDENKVLLGLVKRECRCDEVGSPPTDWGNGNPIPHHCDCLLYAIELPDPDLTPVAYADAVRQRNEQ